MSVKRRLNLTKRAIAPAVESTPKTCQSRSSTRLIRLVDSSGSEIWIPDRIGHGYSPVEVLGFNELHTTYAEHHRLQVFHLKGCKCVYPGCDRVGVYLIRAVSRNGDSHVDLYDKDFNMMSIDHIVPKSMGGRGNIGNLQPMCQEHNEFKRSRSMEDVLNGVE